MDAASLKDIDWRISYRTSGASPDGRPVDILHDFYIPVLRRSVRYDRVAGYFRSTSLAAASQGFSALVNREGHIRLIVGADLDPEDVQAVLDGLQDRLVSRLNARLEGADAWPAEVTRGVELLAWMVAHDALEMRVALRVHARTGEALAVDATDDGYVHEKWAIFTDAEGNRLYASGSLNESRTALMLNAENIDAHCDWWDARDRQRVEEAQYDFERIWEDRHPALRVLPLPEAVRQRLIHLAASRSRPVEIDGTSAAPVEVPMSSALDRLRFALIQDGPRLPGGRYVGLETAPVEPWPHQRIVARRLVETWPYSYLLCDEVGLGKTIEAGLAIRSLILSGLARRVLIAPPASLTEQWQREMADKFLLPFARATGRSHAYLLPYEHVQPTESLYAPDLCIVSTGLLARKERRRELRAAPEFDIALIEEGDDDRQLIESLLQNRTPADLEWERQQLGPLLDTLADLSGPSSKMNRLLEVVRRRLEARTGRVQQMVVFTRFFDTLTDIVRRLGRVYPELRVGTYSGKGGQYFEAEAGALVAAGREEVKHRFLRGEIDVLVCTDAAAEGLNLQTADLLVNFDLPWDPMKVEQRIGRIDRIGQQHEAVYVLHLCYLGSAEETVYGRLLHRLQQIGAIVGTQQLSLLPVTREEFAGLADGMLPEADLEKRARERAIGARQRTASMEIPPEDLYAIYLRLGQQERATRPLTLEAIWETLVGSEYLRALGGTLRDDGRVLLLQGIGDVPDGTALTVDRGLYDAGIPDLEGRLHFATYGDPIFQAVLDAVARFELSGCVRRLTASVPGLPVEVVGYAVACVEGGQRGVRLITSSAQLEGLTLDAEAELSPAEVAPLQEQLQEMAREEFGLVSRFEQVETANLRAGYSQLALDYLLMVSLLEARQRMGQGDEGFWAAVRDVEELIADRGSMPITRLPADSVRKLSGLLFEPVVPTLGQEGHLSAPYVALHAALEAICRLAEGMRERKADLRLEAVLDRARREVQRLLAEMG